MKELLESLIDIQQRLDAPKNMYNSFGKYSYRSLEKIEEAIKPLLKENRCGIRFDDEVVERCGRTFLRTTLHFFNSSSEITCTAEAEHCVQKTGMDSAQITGAASSYARKYAMNAMFAIDDNKDPDTDEFHNQTSPAAEKKELKAKKVDEPAAGQVKQPQNIEQKKVLPTPQDAGNLRDIAEKVGVKDMQALTDAQLNACYSAICATTVSELIAASKLCSDKEFETIKPIFTELKSKFQKTK